MTDKQGFTIEVVRFAPSDPRLGRHVVHDSRSLRYRARASDPNKLASVRHRINTPITDQGQVGSCTGHAGTAAVAADAFWAFALDALGARDASQVGAFALQLYADATVQDPWPGAYEPDDTGSDGLSVAKVLQTRGLISGYLHATSLAAALTGLAERPVMVGTSWLAGMYEPAADGRLDVRGASEGGHEYVLDQLDVERERVWMRNSWGAGWGLEGRAWMPWADLAVLLADSGDCTILVPRSQPAPTPAPAPAPAPEPPAPQPPPLGPIDAAMAKALARLIDNGSCPRYMREAALTWLAVHGNQAAGGR